MSVGGEDHIGLSIGSINAKFDNGGRESKI
jgi:hypothetical protein